MAHNNINNILETHFTNINLLATTIANSVELIEEINHTNRSASNTHLNNINQLASIVMSSQDIIQQMQQQQQQQSTNSNTRTNNTRTTTLFDSIFNNNSLSNRRTELYNRRNRSNNNTALRNRSGNPAQNNSSNNENYFHDNENNVYYFTFDTLNTGLNNQTNTQVQDISFRTLLITNENKNIINNTDTSINNTDSSSNNSTNTDQDYQLYEITQFDFIERPLNDVCPITRERFDSTTQHILMIKNCKHIFNKSALNIWLEQNNTCPCCRGQI